MPAWEQQTLRRGGKFRGAPGSFTGRNIPVGHDEGADDRLSSEEGELLLVPILEAIGKICLKKCAAWL
jgi:hypothetical protein